MSRAEPFVRDNRGTILMIGVMFGLIMVGALWNIVSLGDAIIWREQLQDGADVTAYEQAVWEARGMNILSMLNMIIALVMSFLIWWRIIEGVLLMVWIATLLCGIASLFLPWLAPACTVMGQISSVAIRIFTWMARNDPRVTNRVYRIISRTYSLQKYVATGWPAVATTASLVRGSLTDADFAVAFDPSLMPTYVDKRIKALSTPKDKSGNMLTRPPEIAERVGKPISLPVEKEGWQTVCEKGGTILPDTLSSVLARAMDEAPGELHGGLNVLVSAGSGAASPFSTLMGWIVGIAPGIFCGNFTDFLGKAKKASEDANKKACSFKTACAQLDAADGDASKYYDFFGGESDMRSACQGDETDKFNSADCKDHFNKEWAKKNPIPDLSDVNCVKTWNLARNGNVILQTWSIARKEPERLAFNDARLEVGDGIQVGNLPDPDSDDWTMAQAEFFFDCEGDWLMDSPVGSGCRNASNWKMNWRGRLRRLRSPEDLILPLVEQGIYIKASNLTDDVAGRLTALTKKASSQDWALIGRALGDFKNKAARNLRDWSAGAVFDLYQKSSLQDKLDGKEDQSAVIH